MEEDFDITECIPNAQFNIRHVLRFMGMAQDECTDIQCFNGQQRSVESDSDPYSMMMVLMMGIAFIMYFMGPRTSLWQRNKNGGEGDRGNDNGGQPPPSAVN